MGLNGDQADRLLAGQRSKTLLDPRDRRAEPGLTTDLDRDQVSILRIKRGAHRYCDLAQVLLADRHQTSAAVRKRPKEAQRPVLGMRDNLDDAAGVTDGVGVGSGLLGSYQNPIANARDLARAGLARRLNANFRGRPVRVLVPFLRRGDQFAIRVSSVDIRQHDGW